VYQDRDAPPRYVPYPTQYLEENIRAFLEGFGEIQTLFSLHTSQFGPDRAEGERATESASAARIEETPKYAKAWTKMTANKHFFTLLMIPKSVADASVCELGSVPPDRYVKPWFKTRRSTKTGDRLSGNVPEASVPAETQTAADRLNRLMDATNPAHAPELAIAITYWEKHVLGEITDKGKWTLGTAKLASVIRKDFRGLKLSWTKQVETGIPDACANRIASVVTPTMTKRGGAPDTP
jgi:hypothetical protein